MPKLAERVLSGGLNNGSCNQQLESFIHHFTTSLLPYDSPAQRQMQMQVCLACVKLEWEDSSSTDLMACQNCL